ncbi:hypothetical protein LSAT2_024313 [Lamellibrachia satsuma]|nr:hypothetical protein LSAT2_024313 [Lamellibrachia satsuma]
MYISTDSDRRRGATVFTPLNENEPVETNMLRGRKDGTEADAEDGAEEDTEEDKEEDVEEDRAEHRRHAEEDTEKDTSQLMQEAIGPGHYVDALVPQPMSMKM